MPTGRCAASAGVKATWTRISPLRYPRGHGGEEDVLLPAPGPRDGRLVLRVRARHLPRLHGLRAGRDPLPRPRGRRAGNGPRHDGRAQRAAFEGTGALVTKVLIAINVLVYLVNLAQGSSLSQTRGSLFEKGALFIARRSTPAASRTVSGGG